MRLNKKIAFIFLLSLLSHLSFGQKYSVHREKKSYLGLTGGMNFSFPKVTDKYAVLTSNNQVFDKKYDNLFKSSGIQFGIRYSYHFTNSVSIVTGIGYQSVGFKYFTHYSWADTVNQLELNREMHHLQKISYFTLPILARWDLTKGQLKPYVQGGIFLDFRHQAKKVIHYDNTIDGKETENQLSSSAMVSITDYTRKFNLGVMGGIGISYHTKFITFGLESNFRYGFFKIMNDENRYADLNGFALQYLDVLDQMRWRNVNVQLTASIPINNSVHLNILRRRRY
ncbi:MAG: outer membrane beta-barrel protein [Crocinitomicaceae bacterium]